MYCIRCQTRKVGQPTRSHTIIKIIIGRRMALLLLWLALALDGASALVMGGVGSQAARVAARSSPIRCESEMAWRRRMERERSGLPEPEAPAEAKAPEEAPAAEMVRPMPKPDMATSVDLLFDGGGIGMGQTDTFFGSDVSVEPAHTLPSPIRTE